MDLQAYSNLVLRAVDLARIARAARALRRAPEQDRAAARRALAALMADARGVPMKIGQFLATEDADDPFTGLTQGIEPLPLDDLLPQLEAALGQPIDGVFSEMDAVGTAASLGQVHRARLLDGTEVAVKMRYPGICEAVDAEMRLASLLPGVGPVRRWGFDLSGYKATLRDNMDRELNYVGEAARQEQFLQHAPAGLVVPRPMHALCRPSLLVQTWEGGIPLADAARWPVLERRRAAHILVRTLLHGVFVSGLVHGDPHPGNLRYRLAPGGEVEVVLYDYGCMIEVPREARLALLQLITACQERRQVAPLDGFAAMGFDAAKLGPIEAQLPALCTLLFEPFLQQGIFSTRHWALGHRVEALLGDLKWWFRAAGPPSLLLLMRAFHGLVAQLDSLEIALDWRRVLDETIPAAIRSAADQFQPPRIARCTSDFEGMATFLKVLVTERGEKVVSVAMPAIQVSVLEEIIPEDVGGRIQEAGIDLAAIRLHAIGRGIVPQELFQFESGARSYRVWLE